MPHILKSYTASVLQNTHSVGISACLNDGITPVLRLLKPQDLTFGYLAWLEAGTLDELLDACNVDQTKILEFPELGAITPGLLRLLHRSALMLIDLDISNTFAMTPLWPASETLAPSLIALKTLRLHVEVNLDFIARLAPSLQASNVANLLGPVYFNTTSAGDTLLQMVGDTLEVLELHRWSPTYALFLPSLTILTVHILPWSSDIPPAQPSSLKVLHLGARSCDRQAQTTQAVSRWLRDQTWMPQLDQITIYRMSLSSMARDRLPLVGMLKAACDERCIQLSVL